MPLKLFTRNEHKVVHDQLAAIPDQVRKRDFAIGRFKSTGLVQPNLWQSSARLCHVILLPRARLFLLQQCPAGREPFGLGDDVRLRH